LLLADGANWWAFYMLHRAARFWLYIKSACAAEHDILLLSRGDTCIFPKLVSSVFLDDAFLLNQFLVFCVALC